MTGTLKTDRRAGQVVDPSDINDIATDANNAHQRLNTLTLDGLFDVSVPSPTNGYILTWVAAESLWRALPAPASTGGGGAVASVNNQVGAVVITKDNLGLDQVNNTSDANKPASAAVLGLLGTKADLVSGKIPNSQLPSLVITEYLGTAASTAAMLALSGQRGDFVTRTDATVMADGLPASGDWILTADVPSSLASWHRLVGPASQSGGVTSVNGKTGPAVALKGSDIIPIRAATDPVLDGPGAVAQYGSGAIFGVIQSGGSTGTPTTDGTATVRTTVPLGAGAKWNSNPIATAGAKIRFRVIADKTFTAWFSTSTDGVTFLPDTDAALVKYTPALSGGVYTAAANYTPGAAYVRLNVLCGGAAMTTLEAATITGSTDTTTIGTLA